MNYLAVDTSTPQGSLCLFTENEILAETHWDRQESHAEVLNLETLKLLKSSGLSFSDLDIIACGNGPGSFTGIRVGLNFARSLAYALNKPVWLMNSLKLLALPALELSPKVVVLQSAFRNLVYVAGYSKEDSGSLIEKIPPAAWTFEQVSELDLNRTMVVGMAYEELALRKLLHKPQDHCRDQSLEDRPRASSFRLELGKHKSEPKLLQWSETRPLYIRASEAEEKLRKVIHKPL